MSNKTFSLLFAGLVCLGIYLFVSAPPPLDVDKTKAMIPVEQLFMIVQAENASVRALWTREIVGEGIKNGLKFDERWRDDDVEAGPLPALFLRETAKSLEKNPLRLSLFLGSDFPISPDNRFEGLQFDKFLMIKQSKQPQFFFMADTGLYTGMFADVAVSKACVDCHNEHRESPKKDWRLNDVMGAATWMYPAKTVTFEQLVLAVTVLHQAVREAYGAYLQKVGTFAQPPSIGERWPREGYYLPSLDVFMQAVLNRAAPHTLVMLGVLVDPNESQTREMSHVADP